MMEDILSTGVESDFLKAYGVYEFGANSRPYAMLSFDRGLPVDVNEGVSIKGNTITNKPVEGLVLQNAKHGSQTLKVEYIGSPSCVVGGNPNPQTEGCKFSKVWWILLLRSVSLLLKVNCHNYFIQVLQVVDKSQSRDMLFPSITNTMKRPPT